MNHLKPSRRVSLVAFAALLASAAPALSQDASPSIQPARTGETQASGARSAQTCAADYHARLAEIAQTQLPAYRAASTAIGAVDPALPGRLIFAAQRRPDLEAQARRALDAGTALARRQGRTGFARDANTRWIAERIREDLTDFLRQKPTPFLCAGLAPYLSTLRGFAAQGAPVPERVAENRDAQRDAASRSLDLAFQAMRPAPLPRFAPADRPSAPPIDGLRIAVEMGLREPEAREAPTRLAERGALSRISESQTDPDLPPLAKAHERALASPADTMRAITALMATAQRGGFVNEAGPRRGGAADAARPVLARLQALRAHMDTPAGRIADPIVRPAIEQALSDLEVLDYLQAADGEAADPLISAMFGTMAAIEAAHAAACTCAD